MSRLDDTPPHDEARERRYAACLIDPCIATIAIDGPDIHAAASAIYDGRLRSIAVAAVRLLQPGQPVDWIALAESLDGEHGLHSGQWANEFTELVRAGSVGHAGYLCDDAVAILAAQARRRIIDLSTGLTRAAHDPSTSLESLRDSLSAAASSLDGHDRRRETRSAADVLATWSPLDTTPPARIDCGLPIDLRPDRVWMLAAPPGLGKTALVMQMTFDALRADPSLKAIVANVEVSPADLLTRETARMSGVSATSIMERDYYDGDRERIAYAIASIREIADRLHFVDRHEIDAIERAVQRYDAGLVVLDYIQRIRPRGEHGSRVDALDALMGEIRRLASDGRCVIAVSSLARSRSPGRGGHEGGMSGLRGSGELEYGGDTIYTIEADDMGDGITLKCHKDRHGPKRSIRLTYHRPTQAFASTAAADPFPTERG